MAPRSFSSIDADMVMTALKFVGFEEEYISLWENQSAEEMIELMHRGKHGCKSYSFFKDITIQDYSNK